MNFTEHIITYYNTESRLALSAGMVSGIVLLLTAISFWLFSNPNSMLKGIAVIFLMGGLIFGLGGYFAGTGAKKELPKKLELYKTDTQQFTEQETAKVESIHNAWTGLQLFWSAFIVLGLIALFIASKPFWTGLALGLLIVGTLGHIEESVSKQHNEKYRLEVLQFKTENK